MASNQQYDSEQPKVQEQTVMVHSKVYPTKILGIKDCNVELVELILPHEKVEVKWEKVEIIYNSAQHFLLLNQEKNKALAHGPAGQKVFLADITFNKNAVTYKPIMLWKVDDEVNNIFKQISSPGGSNDKGKHVNLDVNKSTGEVVVNPPSENESQLWKISTFIPV